MMTRDPITPEEQAIVDAHKQRFESRNLKKAEQGLPSKGRWREGVRPSSLALVTLYSYAGIGGRVGLGACACATWHGPNRGTRLDAYKRA